MRVLHVFKTYHPDTFGGVERTIHAIAKGALMHRFLSSVTRIVATSSNYLESSEVLQRHCDKTDVIPIGLDEADYPRAPEELKACWRACFQKPFFLFVGVLRYYKGLHTLIGKLKLRSSYGAAPRKNEAAAFGWRITISRRATDPD